MRIASFNTNDINKRLDNLVAWLAETEPDAKAPAADTGSTPGRRLS